MLRATTVGIFVTGMLLLTGCTSARFLSLDADHGIVAIPNNTNSWPTNYRRSADELLRERFPQGVVIDHEEETVVRQDVTVDRSGNGDSLLFKVFGIGSESRTEHTNNITEWHIYFHTKDAPAPAALVKPTLGTGPPMPPPQPISVENS